MNLERILLDIHTQWDFFLPSGSCYRKAAGQAAKQVYRLVKWAKTEEVPVVSTVLRVRPGETGPLADRPHCIEGTDGEKKLPRTILPNSIDLGMRSTTDLPRDLFDRFQQVIFEMRDTDIFAHPRTERLITELPMATFVICGAGVAGGIVEAAVGLRSRGFGVILASDAVVDLGHPRAEMASRRMEAKGVVFAETSEIVEPKPAREKMPFKTAGAVQSAVRRP